MWGHMDTEQIGVLHGQSQQQWPASESDDWPVSSSIEKNHSLGVIVVAGVVKMFMPMARKMLRLICCDSAFLVVVSTRLIICSVMLSGSLPPVF